jgi:V8-like Glu-specific endopeptidase
MTEGGVNYVCSGTSVAASTGISLVWTAGHCTNEGPGDYVTNFMFAPAYYDGNTPYGRWAETSIQTTSQFQNQGDLMYDFGAARVDPPSGFAGQTLNDVVGSRAMAFNYTVTTNSTRFTSYGYPAAGKFNGQRMWACDSTVTYRDGTDMGIGCNMTGGSSGGGWINSGGALGSVNSYGYNNLKNVMFGPYQGNVAQALYQSMD